MVGRTKPVDSVLLLVSGGKAALPFVLLLSICHKAFTQLTAAKTIKSAATGMEVSLGGRSVLQIMQYHSWTPEVAIETGDTEGQNASVCMILRAKFEPRDTLFQVYIWLSH